MLLDVNRPYRHAILGIIMLMISLGQSLRINVLSLHAVCNNSAALLQAKTRQLREYNFG
jgi:hypothetical protein